jgi:hypothetical protein
MPDEINSALVAEQLNELLLPELLQRAEVNIYDFTAGAYPGHPDALNLAGAAANRLVKEKLAVFTGEQLACITITNFGRYWMIRGGYGAYLREGHDTKEHHNEKQHHKEDLLEARLRLTHFRLIGFWLTLVLSIIGFALSLLNLYLLLSNKK